MQRERLRVLAGHVLASRRSADDRFPVARYSPAACSASASSEAAWANGGIGTDDVAQVVARAGLVEPLYCRVEAVPELGWAAAAGPGSQLVGRARPPVRKVLRRHGVSRQRRTERPQTSRRYEWTEAGAPLHIDAFELPKFDRPGHWAHGDRSEPHKTRGAGKVKVIGVIDDHTRLTYCEIHGAENKHTVSATLRRAARWFLEQGCGPVQAVMSDNAKC
jgi:hypothetical protein